MNIIIGIDKISDIPPLVNAGANDFFCGVVGDKNKFLSHRPNTTQYNLNNLSELRQAIKTAHSYNTRLFLVLNETAYTDKEKSLFIKKIKKLDKMCLDAFIVSDLSLIYLCKKLKIKTKLHLSSLAVCSNSESFKFYKNLNISRIIIPQQISPSEYQEIIKNIDNLETEVFFLLYNNCNNIDGICRYHQKYLFTPINTNISLMPCIYKPNINTFLGLKSEFIKKMESLLQKPTSTDYLGYLYDFYKLGVGTVKLGIRGFPINEKIKRVKYLKELINLISTDITKNEFVRHAIKIGNKYENIHWEEKNFLARQYIVKY